MRWWQSIPDDLDAATMFAESLMMLRPWQLWTLEGEPAPGTLELVAVLESVLKRNPDHPGANHFYIHAVEASPQPRTRHPERDAPDDAGARRRPPRPHARAHLPADRRLRPGRTDQRDAAAADQAFVQRTGATGVYPLMYWTHNMHFIAYARAQQGRYDEAKQAALEMVANVGDADREMQMLEGFLLYPLMVDLRFHRWDDDSRRRRRHGPSASCCTRSGSYARAMALAGQGKLSEAAAEQQQFEALRAAPCRRSRSI